MSLCPFDGRQNADNIKTSKTTLFMALAFVYKL